MKKLLHFSLITAAALYFGACSGSSEPAILEGVATGTGQDIGLAAQTGMEGVVEGTGVIEATVVELDETGDAGDSGISSIVETGKLLRVDSPVIKSLIFPGNYGGVNGWELCRYDLEENTVASVDIQVGPPSSNPSFLTEVDGVVYFAANDGVNGNELWRYDGVTNTATIRNINVGSGIGSNPSFITELNGILYFSANDGTGEGRELAYYDIANNRHGLVRNHLLRTLRPGPASSNPTDLAVKDGVLYFSGDVLFGPSSMGRELYRYDPVNDADTGPQLVADVNTGGASSNPVFMADIDGSVYFAANNGINGNELWVYDSNTNTHNMIEVNPGPASSNPWFLAEVNGVMYFSAIDGDGRELWKLDNNIPNALPVLLADINPGGASSFPTYLTHLDGKVYFGAIDATAGQGYELFTYDIAQNQVDLVQNLAAGFGVNGGPAWTVEANGMLYFGATDGGMNQRELWKSDGASPATMLGNFNPNPILGLGGFLPNPLAYNAPFQLYSRIIKTTW